MTEAHPEAWLELAVTGGLDPDQRSHMERHLAICADCASYVTSSNLFRTEGARQTRAEHLNHWAVERAMAQLAPRRHSIRPWWTPMRWAWLPAAGVLLVAAAVSAKLWTADRSRPAASHPRAVATTTPRIPAHPVSATPPAPAAIAANVNPKVDEKLRAAPQTKHPGQDTAATLFERARSLGRDGKIDAAVRAHVRLQRLFPDTPESVLSSALAGQLLFEHGRVRAALAQFDRHLAHGGAADEEALAGRAASLQHLGRQPEETRAWLTLLERHPNSVYANRAKVRLRDLSAR